YLLRGQGRQQRQAPPVGGLQRLGGERRRERALREEAHVEQRDPVEVAGQGGEVVVHRHHGGALGVEAPKHLDERGLAGGVHARERLVEQVELGLLHQRPRQEDALLLAARGLADLAVLERLHAYLGQRRAGALARRAARPPERTQLAVEPHRHHVEGGGGEVQVDGGALR